MNQAEFQLKKLFSMTRTTTTNDRMLPEHVVIIMDGNGRWAKSRNLHRIAGHRAGVSALKGIVRATAEKGIKALTVYAFSSENWKRPGSEVSLLMELFMTSLQKSLNDLNRNGVRLRFVGDLAAFPQKLQELIRNSENATAENTALELNVAINYGGRWDITRTFRILAGKIASGEIRLEDINETLIDANVCLAELPEPDLFIRTGGEQRISNYLLWQLAYTELYFTDCLWPDFNQEEFEKALAWYAGRERRFGCTSEQIKRIRHA